MATIMALSPRVRESLQKLTGLPATATVEQACTKILQMRAERAESALAHRATAEVRRFSIPSWLEETLGLDGDLVDRLGKIASALGLEATATKAEVMERIGDLYEALGSPVAEKLTASVVFSAHVDALRESDPKLSHGDAQSQVARARRDLYAAIYSR